MIQQVRQMLFRLQDIQYRDFHKRLIPTVDESTVIGVRVPELRKMAKKLAKQDGIEEFLADLPHSYYEENQLQALIIGEEKDFETSIRKTEQFLPYIDNWAVCDQKTNPVYKKHKEELLPYIEKWIKSDRTYTVRYAIVPFIEERCLDVWTHNKAIQKAVESYRITPEQKAYLKTLKV